MRARGQVAWVAAAAALLLAAPPASAQGAAAVVIGGSLSVTAPTNSAAGVDIGPGFVIRLSGDEGFGPSFGLQWFSTPVKTTAPGKVTELGTVYVRPLLFGVSYGDHLTSRLKWFASVGVGPAFCHARGTGELKQAYEQLGLGPVGVKVSDPFAWRVGAGLWMDLGPSFGMIVSLGYLGVRPEISITTNAGDTRYRIDLGSIATSVGFTYGIF